MSRGVAPWWVGWLAARRKAIAGGLSAGLAALVLALADGHFSGIEAPGILLAVLGVGGTVHQVRNTLGDVLDVVDPTEGAS